MPKLSVKGAAFVGRFEGFVGHMYDDPAGFATIGYGHLIKRKRVRNLTAAERRPWAAGITKARALELLREDAVRFERCVDRLVTVPLNRAQFDALVSFAFNLGCGALEGSTLLRHLNAERRRDAADEFLKWDKAGDPPRPMAGLTRRRKDERRLFLTGLYVPGNAPAQPRPPAGPSKSFTWLEVHRGRRPFTAAVRARAVVHARKLEKLRDEINTRRARRGLPPTGLNVLSWFRPRWYNEQVGGASDSRHIYGDGTDFSLQEIERLLPWPGGRSDFDAICETIWANGGLGQYPLGSRHCDTRGRRARWTSF